MLQRIVVLLGVISGLFAATVFAEQSSLWPMPAFAQLVPAEGKSSSNATTLDGSFSFEIIGGSTSVVKNAIDRYSKLIAVPSGSAGSVKKCSIYLEDQSLPPIVGADESYSLQIKSDGSCFMGAKYSWGILHAMETFTQLLYRDSATGAVSLDVAMVNIADAPRFRHRGLLIDTSRHYLSKETIMGMIDGLVMNKFNVLHWHAVDAQSFPLDTPSEPTMSQGAYSPAMTYSMDTLKSLKDYAFDRGVEIIVEIDVPGHAASWTKGKPEVMADCFEKYSYNINDFALNPTVDVTYDTLQGILTDVRDALNPQFLHLGGDEVVYGCWAEDEGIVSYMQQNGISSYDELYSQFVQRADSIVSDLGATVIHWEEVFTSGCTVGKDTIFQAWTDSSKVSQITAAGYSTIAAPSDYWYLDHSDNTWTKMYIYDPYQGISSLDQQSHIIGGEVSMWGEHIDDLNIQSIVYPRASAVGERLWSPSYINDSDAALDRLLIQRCRMVNRGIRSSPVQPAGYCDKTYV